MDSTQKEFYDSITTAIKNNDSQKVISILVYEIGELLANDREELILALKRSFGDKIKHYDSLSDKQIALLVSDGILKEDEKLLNELIITIAKTKQEYSNIIGLIMQGVGALVKGIANAVTAGEKAKAERDIAREGVKTKTELYKAARIDLATGILTSKKKVEETKNLVEARKIEELAKVKNKRRIVFVAASFTIIGVLFFLIVKKSE